MKYGKIENNKMYFAPKKIKHDNSITYNPPVEMLLERGYKPIVETPMPEAPQGYHYELSYEDDGDHISYVWVLVENEPTTDDIMNILLGEEE